MRWGGVVAICVVAMSVMAILLVPPMLSMQSHIAALEETRIEVTHDEILVCKRITQKIYHCSPIVVEAKK